MTEAETYRKMVKDIEKQKKEEEEEGEEEKEGVEAKIRRQWNHWEIAGVELEDIENLHWSSTSGGVQARSPQYFIHGYIMCDRIKKGEFPHSCRHGEGPHRIKVCLTKKDNLENWKKFLEIVGPKPTYYYNQQQQ